MDLKIMILESEIKLKNIKLKEIDQVIAFFINYVK